MGQDFDDWDDVCEYAGIPPHGTQLRLLSDLCASAISADLLGTSEPPRPGDSRQSSPDPDSPVSPVGGFIGPLPQGDGLGDFGSDISSDDDLNGPGRVQGSTGDPGGVGQSTNCFTCPVCEKDFPFAKR